ncbi:50S ribosomal protein L10 [Candidatus Woesearchaeota archaeon]|nr:50S ribosomal protein L10 [Candidatus Woesearchaeota archaeon]
MTKPKAHVSEEKKQVVNDLVSLMKKHSIIGAVNMENLPAPQLQVMREKLRKTVVIMMTKRRLIKIAIEKAEKDKPGLKLLEPYLAGMPALLFTEENPFNLFKTLKKSKSKAPAKGGQTAPNDIVVNAGPTPFAPGPVIGELGSVGLKAGVDAGKVVIKENKVIVKAGEIISQKAADVLTRLGIEPMEVGLNVTGIFENGSILTKEVLDIDDEKFISNITGAASHSFNLAMEIGYLCKETVVPLIGKAARQASSLSLEANFLTQENTGEIISKLDAQAAFLKAELKLS